jgi:oligopeptide transport system ATP-binding protein
MAEQPPLVSVRGLSKQFPVARDLRGRPTSWLSAVDDVALDIRPGETLALVGESGCGKSTLARLILRLIPATAGSISFEGRDITTARERELRSFRDRAQIVFQDPYGSLDPRMKVASIIAEGMARQGLSKQQRRERVKELLDLVELEQTAADRYPHEFSGGQRQRVSIARALAVNPRFVIADEPVSALDVSVQSKILNLLLGLQERFDLTYLFISHDMAVVRHVANRVAVMYLGRVVESGPAARFFANPTHPYSQALLSSVPSVTGRRDRIHLQGDVPSAVDPPVTCRFASRCFRAIDACRATDPQLEPLPGQPDHLVACINYGPADDGRPGDQRHDG